MSHIFNNAEPGSQLIWTVMSATTYSARPTRTRLSNGSTIMYPFGGYARALHWPPWRRQQFSGTNLYLTSRTTPHRRLSWRTFENYAGLLRGKLRDHASKTVTSAGSTKAAQTAVMVGNS
jgi:hypothetical protein